MASADHLGNDDFHAPFGPPWRYADNNQHTHRSIECNNASFLHFNHFVHYTFSLDYNPTDLTTIELFPGCNSYNSSDDVIWWATSQSLMQFPTSLGEVYCSKTSGSTKCDRWVMKLLETMETTHSWAVKWNVACHEIGHTVGFDDGGTAGSRVWTAAIMASWRRTRSTKSTGDTDEREPDEESICHCTFSWVRSPRGIVRCR